MFGWGYPSTGTNKLSVSCLDNGKWSPSVVEHCTCELTSQSALWLFDDLPFLDLPCRKTPPPPPEGGWSWYSMELMTYKCPHSLEFANVSNPYPHYYIGCTAERIWEETEVPGCTRKQIFFLAYV